MVTIARRSTVIAPVAEHRGPRVTEVVGLLPYASNATLLGRDRDGQPVVYKPDRGQQPLWDFDADSLSARETLTYEVSAAMGIGVVPETWLADGPFGPGSAQRWVDEDIDADPRPLLRGPDERLWPIAVLDLVCNNADRKLGHVLTDKDGRLWAIDHGLTFHPLPKLRTVLWGFSGERLPPEMVQALQRLCTGLDDWLGARVADLLGSGEEVCLRRRVDELLAIPIHPAPPTDRPPVPWPAW
jgi:hypothetical protein